MAILRPKFLGYAKKILVGLCEVGLQSTFLVISVGKPLVIGKRQ